MDLDDIRRQIDQIDDQISTLFAQRMTLSARVAAFKLANQLPVYVPEREQAVLKHVTDKIDPALEQEVTELYEKIFALSKNYQTRIIASPILHKQDIKTE